MGCRMALVTNILVVHALIDILDLKSTCLTFKYTYGTKYVFLLCFFRVRLSQLSSNLQAEGSRIVVFQYIQPKPLMSSQP